jgi:hypothetical protein
VKYAIGKQRDVILKRDKATGEWHGEGHGYRIRLTRTNRLRYGEAWHCRVFGTEVPYRNILIGVCNGHTLKWTLQEGVRLADRAIEIRASGYDDIEKDALLAVARVAGRVDAQLPAVKDPEGAWLKMSRTHSAQYHVAFVNEYNAAYDGVRTQVLATKHPFHCDCNACEHFRAEHGS